MKPEISDDLSRRIFLRGAMGVSLFATSGCEKIEDFLGMEPQEGPVVPPSGEGVDLVSHVLNRLTFGPDPSEYARVKGLGVDDESAVAFFLEEQLSPNEIEDKRTQRAVRRLEAIHAPLGELYEYKEDHLLEQLTRATLIRATRSRRQLFEVMVHFWSDHFNIDISKKECRWLKVADDREVVRKHAMGNFSALLKASALSPAMLWYLDGRENRKSGESEKPNENYARELLELHTLGVGGGYTQKDVMEVARCLSGWTVRGKDRFFKGKVEFHADAHDDGAKVVLGNEIASGGGRKDLDDILEIVGMHPSTARFLGRKLCIRFISDDPSEASIKKLAGTFLSSNGNIKETLRAVFATQEFLQGPRAQKLKRPFEFIVSALRGVRARVSSEMDVVDYLIRMGHAPFQYPTPDGYPDIASPWTGTLLWRWHFAIALARNEVSENIKVEEEVLIEKAGGVDGLAASLLGRNPSVEEKAAIERSGEPLALLMASPGFQWK